MMGRAHQQIGALSLCWSKEGGSNGWDYPPKEDKMDKILWADLEALIFISLTMGAINLEKFIRNTSFFIRKTQESTSKKVT